MGVVKDTVNCCKVLELVDHLCHMYINRQLKSLQSGAKLACRWKRLPRS